jgi:hypothetical protein
MLHVSLRRPRFLLLADAVNLLLAGITHAYAGWTLAKAARNAHLNALIRSAIQVCAWQGPRSESTMMNTLSFMPQGEGGVIVIYDPNKRLAVRTGRHVLTSALVEIISICLNLLAGLTPHADLHAILVLQLTGQLVLAWQMNQVRVQILLARIHKPRRLWSSRKLCSSAVVRGETGPPPPDLPTCTWTSAWQRFYRPRSPR